MLRLKIHCERWVSALVKSSLLSCVRVLKLGPLCGCFDFRDFSLEGAWLHPQSQALSHGRQAREVNIMALLYQGHEAGQGWGSGLLSLAVSSLHGVLPGPVSGPPRIINCTANNLSRKQFFGISKYLNSIWFLVLESRLFFKKSLLNLPFYHKCP